MYFDIADARKKTGLKGFSHTDQVVYMLDWYNAFRKRMSAYGIVVPPPEQERWCFDGAALTQDLMLEWRKTTRFNCVAVTNKDIERDNARLINSFKSGQLCILDMPDNAVSVEQLETFATMITTKYRKDKPITLSTRTSMPRTNITTITFND